MPLVWKSITVPQSELQLHKVLRCGQAFRWKNIDNVWSSSLGNHVLFLRQDSETLHFASLPHSDAIVNTVHDYFNLDVSLTELFAQWSHLDPVFRKTSVGFEGVRMLRQDPWENLVSFICSSNNNIKRISQMCDNLCLHFGDHIATHEGIKYYSFPKPEVLSKPNVEQRLRDLSFGYRAKYIHKTAQLVLKSPRDHLDTLRKMPYEEAHTELLKFTGVGPKVADCVCLMSLDKHDAIPVDTHVYQIAKRDYKLKSKGDAVTPKTYELVRKLFVDLWGPYAGWAQSVVFAADLKDMNNGLNQVEGSPVKLETKTTKKRTAVKEEIISDEVHEEIKIEIKEEEIEYSITGRPKRRKTIKTEA